MVLRLAVKEAVASLDSLLQGDTVILEREEKAIGEIIPATLAREKTGTVRGFVEILRNPLRRHGSRSSAQAARMRCAESCLRAARSASLIRCPLPVLVLAAAISAAGCDRSSSTHETAPSAAPSPSSEAPTEKAGGVLWFEDVTARVGLEFIHDAGPTGRYFFPQIAGSGAAFFDFDNDGRLDVYLIQNTGPDSSSTNRLYRQVDGGKFVDASAGSGLDVAGYGMGAAAGDVNNDGHMDLCLTEYGRVRLFVNQGDGTFADVSEGAGISSLLWGTSAAFFDYDRDGWLDLVVVNYVDYDAGRWCADADGQRDFCGPHSFPGTATKLWHNLGARGGADGKMGVRFKEVTLDSGLGRTRSPGLGIFCADFDGDRWPDIFVANDGAANHLWINQRDGTFREEAVERGIAYNSMGQTEANMGVAVGDVNGDALFDIVVTHLTEERNTLWAQDSQGLFQDRTAAAGLTTPRWRGTGFGTALVDFDHDGAPDLVVVNGRVKRTAQGSQLQGRQAAASADPPAAEAVIEPGRYWEPYLERNQLFRNEGGRFRDVSSGNAPLCGKPGVYRGLACADFDNDGAVDLLVSEIAGPARLYRNVAPGRGHWLAVRAVDSGLGRDAYGAEVTVRAGGRRWVRWVNPAYSYLCSNDPRAHFGLGDVSRVDSIDVVWPDGSEERFSAPAVDGELVLHKGRGTL